MSTDITIFVNPTQWIELDISGIEFITFLGKDGKSYIAISALGSPDNFARICRASFKDCYVEVFKRENLSAREVFNEWKNLSKKTKISILIFMKTAERAAGEYAVYFDENRTKDYPNGCVRFNECKRNAFLAGVDFAQQWISVEDELPKENMLVLVKITSFNIVPIMNFALEVDKYVGETWFITANCYQSNKVTHWRPIEIE